jgi:hypothetical protein
MAHERQGDEETAIRFYKANVRDGVGTPFPYERLAIICRRRKDYVSEAEVLQRAVEVFQRVCDEGRTQFMHVLGRFTVRLEKARRMVA